MIIIAGTFDVDPAQRDEFLALRVPALAATREEPGCLDYVMCADPTAGMIRGMEVLRHDVAKSGPLF